MVASQEEQDKLVAAQEKLAAARGDLLMSAALRVEVVRLSRPEGCTCGTPLYRHPTVFGGYYTAACHRVLEQERGS